jgi:murein DD-endopeptidase MepM/ murein hydrolase activator NlpD
MIPVAGVTWSELRDTFHEMRGTRVHNALDIMAPRGTVILAADAGTLLKLHNSVGGGLTAYASDPTNRFIYLYGHLDAYNPSMREGQTLKKGDTIGYVGSTGNAAAAGPHLHFAIARSDNMSKWWQGTPIDPRPVLSK